MLSSRLLQVAPGGCQEKGKSREARSGMLLPLPPRWQVMRTLQQAGMMTFSPPQPVLSIPLCKPRELLPTDARSALLVRETCVALAWRADRKA